MYRIPEMLILASFAMALEVIFNAARTALTKSDERWPLKGTVSIWMFLVYAFGLTYGFDAIYIIMSYISHSNIVRWLSYPLWIWLIEILIGSWTDNKLWDYSDIPFNWKGVISLLHFPAWIIFGVLFEYLRFAYWNLTWL